MDNNNFYKDDDKMDGAENGNATIQNPYSEGMNPYGEHVNPYEQSSTQDNESNIFGQNTNESNIFGQNTNESNIFGQDNNESNVFGQNTNESNVFGENTNESNVFGQNTFGQDGYGNNSYGNNPYGSNPYDSNVYGQNNGARYDGQTGAVVDFEGRPLKNNFGMKLTFSILEMLTLLSCNLITFILGLIACVQTVKADNLYKQGRGEEYKSAAKAATILLWIGFAITIIYGFIAVVVGVAVVEETRRVMYEYPIDEYINEYDQYSDDFSDYVDDYMEEYGDELDEYLDYYNDYLYSDDYEDYTDDTYVNDSYSMEWGEDYTGSVDDLLNCTINGYAVKVPMTVNEFVATGIPLETENLNYYVNPDEYGTLDIYNASGEAIGYVALESYSDEPIKMSDATVTSICLYYGEYYEETAQFLSPTGATQFMSADELIGIYGEPTYFYEDYDTGYSSYEWSINTYDETKNVSSTISYSFEDGEVSTIDISHYYDEY